MKKVFERTSRFVTNGCNVKGKAIINRAFPVNFWYNWLFEKSVKITLDTPRLS